MNTPSLVILTATLAEFGDGSNYINGTRNHNLCRVLNQNGLEFIGCTGYYRGQHEGESFLVTCDHPQTLKALIEIAERFGQESIIVDGALLFVTGPKAGQRVEHVGCVYGEAARACENYTLADGRCFSYQYPAGTFDV